MKAISVNIRCLAVENFLEHKTVKETCKIFHISRASLYRFFDKYKKGQSLEPLSKLQSKKFSEEQLSFLLQLVKKKHCVTVSHLTTAFTRKYGISISARTIRRVLKQNNYTHKRLYVRRRSAKKSCQA